MFVTLKEDAFGTYKQLGTFWVVLRFFFSQNFAINFALRFRGEAWLESVLRWGLFVLSVSVRVGLLYTGLENEQKSVERFHSKRHTKGCLCACVCWSMGLMALTWEVHQWAWTRARLPVFLHSRHRDYRSICLCDGPPLSPIDQPPPVQYLLCKKIIIDCWPRSLKHIDSNK